MFMFKLTLVSSDPGALGSVADYLASSGASLSSASRLADARAASAGADAVILFADDYSHDDVVRTISELRSARIVLITAFAADFAELQGHVEAGTRIVVLPRPTWGWMILDAVRFSASRAPEFEGP